MLKIKKYLRRLIFFIFGIMNELLIFALLNTEVVAQLVRASDCGSEGRGFETPHPPSKKAKSALLISLFLSIIDGD